MPLCNQRDWGEVNASIKPKTLLDREINENINLFNLGMPIDC